MPVSTAFDFASRCAEFTASPCLAPILPSILHKFISKSHTMDPQTQLDIASLSDADKKELNQVLTNEAQKSNVQQGKLLLGVSN